MRGWLGDMTLLHAHLNVSAPAEGARFCDAFTGPSGAPMRLCKICAADPGLTPACARCGKRTGAGGVRAAALCATCTLRWGSLRCVRCEALLPPIGGSAQAVVCMPCAARFSDRCCAPQRSIRK